MPEPKTINEILGDLGLGGAANRATAPEAIGSVLAAIATVVNPDSTEEDQRAAAKNCLEVTGNSDMLVIAGLQSDSLRVAEEIENDADALEAAEIAYQAEIEEAELAHQEAMKRARENFETAKAPAELEAPVEEANEFDTAAQESADEQPTD